MERKVVIPGEVIVSGEDYLPGEGTEKRGQEIVAIRYGLAEESSSLVKVIALSGIYQPRRGNVVIGKVENITFNGWVVDINSPTGAFLPLAEVPRFVSKDEMSEVLDIGDMLVAKILGVNGRGIDLTIKMRGLGKIEEGMIKIVKNETGCNITVGQNGLIWIKGERIEDELFVKRAIMFITEKSFTSGLTEEVQKWFDKHKKGEKEKE